MLSVNLAKREQGTNSFLSETGSGIHVILLQISIEQPKGLCGVIYKPYIFK